MQIQGFPIAAQFPSDPDFQDRFWFWTGASGRKYIHSVYRLDDCPPLPGAIYVAVRREGPLRIVMGVGHFMQFWDGTLSRDQERQLRASGIDEIHVHLMAKSPEASEAVLGDLLAALESDAPAYGAFSEPVQGRIADCLAA